MKTVKSKKFIVKIYLVILATDISNNKQYILSKKSDEIELPNIILSEALLDNLEKNIVTEAQTLVFANELELLPQLISLHNKYIDKHNNEINCVYGFVLKKTDNINNSYWIEFSYNEPNKYSDLIFETIQKLK